MLEFDPSTDLKLFDLPPEYMLVELVNGAQIDSPIEMFFKALGHCLPAEKISLDEARLLLTTTYKMQFDYVKGLSIKVAFAQGDNGEYLCLRCDLYDRDHGHYAASSALGKARVAFKADQAKAEADRVRAAVAQQVNWRRP